MDSPGVPGSEVADWIEAWCVSLAARFGELGIQADYNRYPINGQDPIVLLHLTKLSQFREVAVWPTGQVVVAEGVEPERPKHTFYECFENTEVLGNLLNHLANFDAHGP